MFEELVKSDDESNETTLNLYNRIGNVGQEDIE